MNMIIFFTLLGLLALFSLWIGKWTSGNAKDNEDYFLSGRNLGFFSLTLTLLATQLGGGTMMGAAEEAYSRGWVVFLYPLGNCLGLLMLAMGFGAKLRKLNLVTVSELFERVYGSVNLRQLAALLSTASMFFILIGQGIAARRFFFTLGVDQPWIFVIFWSVLVIYTVMGGLKAVVYTDVLQGLFVLAAMAIAFAVAWVADVPTSMAVSSDRILPDGPAPWMAWLLLPLLFTFIEQDMGQRCFAAKTPRLVSKAAAASAVLLFGAALISIYFGTLASSMDLDIPAGTSILMAVVQATTNPVITAIFAVAILMAIISTADSLLCSISSQLSCDFPVLKGGAGLTSVVWAQGITAILGIVTGVLCFYFNNVVAMIILSYELSVYALFVPVVMAVITKQPSRNGAIGSMVCGAAAYALLKAFPLTFGTEILTLAISFAGYGIGRMIPVRADSKLVKTS
jgi:SSS family solute:Na+ symporter